MLLAPLAVLPLAGIVALVVWTGSRADVSPLATAVVAVTTLALGSRAFHLDGLADTADGLTASYDRERSLAVMRTGAAGPAGVVAVVLVSVLVSILVFVPVFVLVFVICFFAFCVIFLVSRCSNMCISMNLRHRGNIVSIITLHR